VPIITKLLNKLHMFYNFLANNIFIPHFEVRFSYNFVCNLLVGFLIFCILNALLLIIPVVNPIYKLYFKFNYVANGALWILFLYIQRLNKIKVDW